MKSAGGNGEDSSENEIWNYKSNTHVKRTVRKKVTERRSSRVRKTKCDWKAVESNDANSVERCPSCQAPMHLFVPRSRELHVTQCLDTAAVKQQECPDGAVCKSNIAAHYSSFKHELLASILAGIRVLCNAGAVSGADTKSTISDVIENVNQPSPDKAPNMTCSELSCSADSIAALGFSAGQLCRRAIAALNWTEVTQTRTGSDVSLSVDNRPCKLVCDSCEKTVPDSENEVDDDCFVIDHDDASDELLMNCVSNICNDEPSMSVTTAAISANEKETITVDTVHSSPKVLDKTPAFCSSQPELETGKSPPKRPGSRLSTSSSKLAKQSSTSTNQASIKSFFKPTLVTDGVKNAVNLPARNSTSNIKEDSEEKQTSGTALLKRHCNSSSDLPKSGVIDVRCNGLKLQSAPSTESSVGGSKVAKRCPFYKRIPGTAFAVDAFSYGTIPGCTAYFLSHFHADHYGGLTKKFQHAIYCSTVTANLVQQKLRIAAHLLHLLPIGVPQTVDGVEVTLLDANHCPGSVMFLFKTPGGEVYLHTGDFRADPDMQQYPQLQSIRVSQLFLDTTYCDPQYTFPRQQDVINFAVRTSVEFLQTRPDALIVSGTYTIGKERLFIAIAEMLDSKICVTREKKLILDCLNDPALSHRLTLNKHEARVHVLGMNQINIRSLSTYLDDLRPQFDHVLAFEPTGWTYTNKLLSVDNIRPRINSSSVTVYGVPYSEHSSYEELRQFVQFVRPGKIIPTVNNGSERSRQAMNELFQSWMSTPTNRSAKPPRQSALSDWFSG